MSAEVQKVLEQATAFDKQIERLQDRCVIMKECGPAMKPEQLAAMIHDAVDTFSNGIIVLRNMFSLAQESLELNNQRFIQFLLRYGPVEKSVAEMYTAFMEGDEEEIDPEDLHGDPDWWKKFK